MRACEGCRRRKIKCDSATTNTWPCSACIRLKLHCVPPTVNYDRDFASNPQGYEQERVGYESAGSGEEEYHQQQVSMQQQMSGQHKSIPPIYTQQIPYQDPVGVYQSGSYGEPSSAHGQPNMHYSSMQTPVSIIDQHQHQHYTPQGVFPTPPLQQHPSHGESPETYEQDQYGQQNLADLLGELRMNEAGTGRQ